MFGSRTIWQPWLILQILLISQNISETDEQEMGPELRAAAERVKALPDTRPEPHEVFEAVVPIIWTSISAEKFSHKVLAKNVSDKMCKMYRTIFLKYL
jgi:hypothetical protein